MEQVIHFILMPIVWIPIVGVLGFLTYRNYRKLHRLKILNVDSVLLMLEIPRTNDKKELAAEQMFASLHGILRDASELKNSGGVQEHISFEIVSTGGQIRFFRNCLNWQPNPLLRLGSKGSPELRRGPDLRPIPLGSNLQNEGRLRRPTRKSPRHLLF